jgi:hypothetical protein
LNRDAGNVAVTEILDRTHGRRIDPAGAGGRDHDQGGSVKSALTLELLERQFCAPLCGIGAAQADIDADGLPCSPSRQRADLRGART